MDIQKIGIIGAGQMGNGIAHVMALAEYDILLNDVNADALNAAMSLIDKNLERQVSRDKITAVAKADAMARIKTTQDIAEVGASI